jgi:hypothetical protein
LGAFEACRNSALAYRQGDRAGLGKSTPIIQ